MLRKTLTAALIAAGLTASTVQTADASPRHIHHVTLPAVHVVQPYCTDTGVVNGHPVYRKAAHVRYTLLGSYESPKGGDWLRYTVEAHTVSKAYRWHTHRAPGKGWDRFTRRTATFTFDVLELPDCAVADDPTV